MEKSPALSRTAIVCVLVIRRDMLPRLLALIVGLFGSSIETRTLLNIRSSLDVSVEGTIGFKSG